MNAADIRKKYLAYMEKQGHAIVPSTSLMPDNDPTTLFTGSGMQQMVPYLLGESHPKGTRVTDSQKCFRAEDIEEVGDNRHTTFFEMLGNWSFGDYFKDEQLTWMVDFLIKEVGLDPERMYVTCFIGDPNNDIPRDEYTAELWQKLFKKLGIEAEIVEMGTEEQGAEKGMGTGRIFYYDASKNWWSRAGTPDNMPAGEPGGPDAEIFYDFGTEHDPAYGENCHPNCDCGRFLEIGNNVFMEYIKRADGTFAPLPNKNVDFGGGLERIAAAANGDGDMFKIGLLWPIVEKLQSASGRSYDDETDRYAFRVIADHIRGAVFMIGDGVLPSNKEQGYVLRRLLRRAMFYATELGLSDRTLEELVPIVIDLYMDVYPELDDARSAIMREVVTEEEKFHKTLERGRRELKKRIDATGHLSGEDAFVLFTTYGFPLEMTIELARDHGIEIDHGVYRDEFEKHRTLSRSAAEGKFKGGLADHGEKTTMLHTCTHLMLAALRQELGDDVHQAGSNITAERTRFDFTHGEKVERDVLDRVENFVNGAIKAAAPVKMVQMDKEEARAQGVEGSFWEKYPDTVNVYTMANDDTVYSQELCGGPHVENTGDIQGVFKITSEKSSSAGVRRIKAHLE